MNLIHKVVTLESGTRLRLIASVCIPSKLSHPIYQYIVDMLFTYNRWERVYVSQLYKDKWTFLLHYNDVCQKGLLRFEDITLAVLARTKYGQNKRFKEQEESSARARDKHNHYGGRT